MIIIKAQGGLGNQMFQYALYKKFENDGKNVKMDIYPYKAQKMHNGFELNKIFNLKINYADSIESFLMIDQNYINELEDDRFYNFQKDILNVNNCYLDGYWLNEKYFKEMRKSILDSYSFKVDDRENISMLEKIQSSESVSIHVRRGDFLSISDFSNIATIDYYNEALGVMRDKLKNPQFYIFSDDIEWVKENLNIDNCVFINFNRGENSYKDMFLMSKCKHNIIANSTFSWWGAWLNSNPEKIVIRPHKWLHSAKADDDMCTSSNWIRCGILKEKDFNNTNNEKVKYIHDEYVEIGKYELLNSIFQSKEYKKLKSLSNIKNKNIYYFNLRVNIIEKNDEEAEKNFYKFTEIADVTADLNLYISAIFHFAEYKYIKKEYYESEKLFAKIDKITQGQHCKAKRYLEMLNNKA